MPEFSDLIAQGSAHAWLFIPSAILLGILHGLEPGHSKTMMAAFIVAVRGTIAQAVLLGIAATLSHTAIVWVIAFAGMYVWQGVDAETFEPYFQLASGALIIAIALWMLWRTWQDQHLANVAIRHSHHGHSNWHDHARSHEPTGALHDGHDEIRRIDTGHGVVALEIFEKGGPPVWRLRMESGQAWRASDVTIATEHADGSRRVFCFTDKDSYLESTSEIAEPHEFIACLSLGHGNHTHDYHLPFVEGQAADEAHEDLHGLDVTGDGYQDAHARAHVNDIRRKFTDRKVTTGQIVLFGLTGGLVPCPAAITVLLLCLQLKQFSIGFVLVLCFSIGLAITLVTVGTVAAIGVSQATKRSRWFDTVARRAPYFSSLLIICVGMYVGIQGWREIVHLAEPSTAFTQSTRG